MTHRIINGLTANETGLILGKKPNAIYQIQHRATKRLQRMLLTAAVLVIVIGAAVLLARQASRQTVDSSPARPTVDQIEPATTTTTESTGQRPAQNLTEEAELPSAERIETPGVGEPQEPEPRSGAVEGATNAPSDTTTTTAAAALNDQTTTTSPPSTTSQPAEPGIPTSGRQPVVAVDDSLRLSVGQSVDFDVMANDGPRSSLGTVSRISGSVAGLTLTPEGRLVGTPTEARSAVIVYRLNGNNDTSDIGQIQIVVE